MLRWENASENFIPPTVQALQLILWGSVGLTGLYSLPEPQDRQVRPLWGEKFRFFEARNILLMTASRY
jgi:hypothetical protein